ncbi:hypothetical protein BpHYR1_009689 [Brachionus plicatilis]|uniref:Uncharacterized protein n=1 Tax=Brachionus plicatilis TaxID=10195 RepID=A0A3M7RK60_BRAPC|nr:hypothetical protein BpHYR1_009689 [Brachionus plicatilis]
MKEIAIYHINHSCLCIILINQNNKKESLIVVRRSIGLLDISYKRDTFIKELLSCESYRRGFMTDLGKKIDSNKKVGSSRCAACQINETKIS